MVNLVSLNDGSDGKEAVAKLLPSARRIWATRFEYANGAVGVLKTMQKFVEELNLSLSYRLFIGLALCETAPDGVEENLDILSFLGVGFKSVRGLESAGAFRPVLLSNRRG